MKNKFLLMFAGLCLYAATSFAAQVSVQDAQTVALNFYKLKTGNGLGRHLTSTLTYTRTAADNTVLFYVFNMSPGKGFVIVSATDNDVPVIGYSTESAFGNDFSKIGLNDWLANWSKELHNVIANQIIATPKAAALWSAYRQGISPGGQRSFGVSPLCNTTWDQENEDGPSLTYNLDCPNGNGNGQAITGCVATAMGQIMKYWNFPVTGLGSASYDDAPIDNYSYNYGELSYNYATTTFDWADMPDSLTNTTTPTQNQAVANLLYAAGVAVHMNYGPTASGAWVIQSESTYGTSSQTAYPTNFGYNPNTLQAVFMNNYSNSAWIELIENELNDARPVQYQGTDEEFESGHTWVCDGYDADDYLHMNWGWSGAYDGYFSVTSLEVDGYDFDYDLGALIGIEPGTYASVATPYICQGDSAQLSVNGAAGNSTYSWLPTTGLSCSTCANPKAAPQTTTTYTVSVTSAGSTVTSSVTVNVLQSGVFTYSLSDSSFCLGGAATLSLPGIVDASITPSASVTWIDSTTATLSPTVTTTYHIASRSSICGTVDTGSVTVVITGYSPVTVDLTDSVLCEFSQTYLSITGLTNISLLPYDYYEESETYFELEPYGTTTYTLSGTTSCGSTYTDTFTVYVVDYANLPYTLSQSSVCQGDTSLLTLAGVTDVSITPEYSAVSIGNNQYLLIPDVSTTYDVSAYVAACDEDVYGTVEVDVVTPGQLNYTISPTSSCGEAYVELTVSGVLQPVNISPYEYLDFTSPNYAYADFDLDTTTTFTITAETVCGNFDTAYATVTVEPEPAVAVNNGTICRGDSTKVSVVGLNLPSFYPETGFTQINSTEYVFYPTETTEYEVYGTSCSGYDDYLYFTITVQQSGGLDYIWYDSVLCNGYESEIYLYGVKNAQFNPYVFINWTDSTDGYVDLYPTQTTTYALTATTVCGSTVDKNFTVKVENEPSYNLGSSTICSGDSTYMTVTGLAEVNIYPTTGVTWINDSLVEFNPTTTTYYELSGYTCSGYYEEYSVDITVLQTDGLSYYIEDSTLCPDNETYVELYGAYNVTVTPYIDLEVEDSTTYFGYIYPTQTTTYVASGTSVCTNSIVTDTFTVYILTGGTYILSNTTVCNGDSVLLQPIGLEETDVVPSTYVSYTGSNYYLYPPATTVYTLSGYAECTGTEFAANFTISTASEVVSIDAPDTIICRYDSTIITATTTGTALTSYLWNTGQTSSSIVAYTTGYYSLEATATNNCIAQSNRLYIQVISLTNNIAAHEDSLIADPASAYQWYLNGDPIASATSNFIIPTQAGSYTVQLTSGNCQTFSSPYVITGINPIGDNNIQVYPNPSSGHWYIQADSKWIGSHCEIFDAQGKLVYSTEIGSLKSEIIIDLAAGVYTLKIASDADVFSTRLVKM